MYYPCSENKVADQLRGYREAELRLCFRICKKPFFSQRGSYMQTTKGQNSCASGHVDSRSAAIQLATNQLYSLVCVTHGQKLRSHMARIKVHLIAARSACHQQGISRTSGGESLHEEQNWQGKSAEEIRCVYDDI